MSPRRTTLRYVLPGVAFIISLGLGSCAQVCPNALLEGTLIEQDGELFVATEDDVLQRVDWPASGYQVREVDGRLVVAHWLGVKAGEGDFVSLGGGEYETGWRACSSFTIGETGE